LHFKKIVLASSYFKLRNKMAFTVDILTAVNRLNGNIPFLQPVIEAISNSIEAGATNILVDFEANEYVLPNMPKKITGISVKDDGEGFTLKNREAFTKLWTDNKITIGCKGVGRLTWLRVFNQKNSSPFRVG
jgi:hypothetical protein